MQKTQKIFFLFTFFLAMIFSHNAYAMPWDDPRFSRALSYELMDLCVTEETVGERKKKIAVCACALERTQEDGFLFDYDHDGDFWEAKDEFWSKFRKNIKHCSP